MIIDAVELIRLVVELGEPMSWTVHDPEELRERQHEVNNLRDEEEEHSLGEVSQDANDSKGHPREVAEGVTNEDLGWEAVVLQKSQCCRQEGDHQGKREKMVLISLA